MLVHYVAAVLNMLDSSMITLIYTKGTDEIIVSETLNFFLVFYDNGRLRGSFKDALSSPRVPAYGSSLDCI